MAPTNNTEEYRRKLICNFQDNNPTLKKSEVVKHFVTMGISRRSIYSILSNYEKRKTTTRAKGSGNFSTLSHSKTRARLAKLTSNKVAKSYRELGNKLECSKTTVKKYLESMGIKRRTRKRKPAVSETQEKTQKIRLSLLTQNVFHAQNDIVCVMDDESYFTMDGNEWQGQYYYERDDNVDKKVKYVEHTKYPKKVLLWLAISPAGMSEPVFLTKGLAQNSDVYIRDCLPKLKAFINKYHRRDNVIFWPDLAPSHYSRKTINALEELGIPVVKKEENPPNVPQLRPIETFWANLKRKVYARDFRPKTEVSLMAKIKRELKKMPTSTFSTSMAEVPRMCRKAHRIGPDFFLK